METMTTRAASRAGERAMGSHRPSLAGLLLLCPLVFGCVTTTTADAPASPEKQAKAQMNVGLDYLGRGNTSMAIRKLQEALDLSPENAEVLLWLGEGYRRKERLVEAQGYMERALAISPQSHLVRLNLSGLYIQLELYDDSIEQSNALIDDATFGRPWQALNNRGWAEFQSGRLDAAETSFTEALDYHKRFWPSRLNLGILASQRGRKRQAVEHFTEVLERGPDAFALAEANYRIGEVYISWGHRDKAIGYFQAAVDDSPDSRWGEQSKGYLDMLD